MKKQKTILIIILAIIFWMMRGNVSFSQTQTSSQVQTPENFLYLSWESNGMVPVDYLGKAIPARFAVVKVLVQPLIYSSKNKSYFNTDDWSYQWYVDDNLILEGKGLKECRFRLEDLDKISYKVTVKVLTSLSTTPFEKTITINLAQPALYFRPVGEKKIVINQYSTSSKALILETVPFFFASDDPTKLHYMWRVNDKRFMDFDNQKTIILPKVEEGENNYTIQLTIEDLRDIIVRASSMINITLK